MNNFISSVLAFLAITTIQILFQLKADKKIIELSGNKFIFIKWIEMEEINIIISYLSFFVYYFIFVALQEINTFDINGKTFKIKDLYVLYFVVCGFVGSWGITLLTTKTKDKFEKIINDKITDK